MRTSSQLCGRSLAEVLRAPSNDWRRQVGIEQPTRSLVQALAGTMLFQYDEYRNPQGSQGSLSYRLRAFSKQDDATPEAQLEVDLHSFSPVHCIKKIKKKLFGKLADVQECLASMLLAASASFINPCLYL